MLKAILLLRNMINWGASPYSFKKTWTLGLILPAATGLLLFMRRRSPHLETVDEQANRYIPIQSDSEKAAGHPFVGSY